MPFPEHHAHLSLLRAGALCLGGLGLIVPLTVVGHNLDQQNTFISLDKPTVDLLESRAAGSQTLLQQNDVIGVICKTTPGPGTNIGAGGYLTFYIPPGTQVVGVEYGLPDGFGGFTPVPIKPPAEMPMGDGPIAAAKTTALVGLSLGPNAAGDTALTVNGAGTHNGTLAGVYGDTGIFFSTDQRTVWQSFTASGGYDRNPVTNDTVLTNNSLDAFVPVSRWDAEQLMAFGLSKPAAPIIDPNGRGNAPWGMASPVAGPQSGYAWAFNRDYWLANPMVANRMKLSVQTGPWQRIRYSGSTIAADTPGLHAAVHGVALEDASALGVNASSLAPTYNWTDSTSPKAIRVAFGSLVLGRSEYARIRLKILANRGQPNSPFDSNGHLSLNSEAFGGDAGGSSNGRDHVWRYYRTSSLSIDTYGLLMKRFVSRLVSPGEASYFDLTVVNTGTAAINNVVIRDPMPAGLSFTSASITPSSTNPLTWNLGTIPAQGVQSIRVNFTATGKGTIFNTATMNSSDGVRTATDSIDVVSIIPDDPEPVLGLGNLVFEDLNGNGRADAGEGIDGVTVELFNEVDESAPQATTVTANGGRYQFTGLFPGTYFVHLPAGQFGIGGVLSGLFGIPGTQPGDDDAGENGEDDAQPWINGINSRDVVLYPGGAPTELSGETGFDSASDDAQDSSIDLTVDLGLFRSVGVGNLVFTDLNGNGHADEGEGVDDVTVQIYTAAQTPGVDMPVDTVVTSGGGRYQFAGLPGGFYRLHIPAEMFTANTPLHGSVSIPQFVAGDDNVGEDGSNETNPEIDGTTSQLIALFVGQCPTNANGETGTDATLDDAFDASVDLTVDFGFYHPLGVGNVVFFDANGNGHRDGGEGVENVTVNLYRDTDTPGSASPVATQQTDASGHYLFDYLPAGSYFIYIPAEEFNLSGDLDGLVSMTGAGQGAVDDATDENGADDFSPNQNGIRSTTFTLANNTAPTDATGETGFLASEDSRDDDNYDLTIDLGFRLPDPGSVGVGNAIFFDTDGNGQFDAGEGLTGVRVKLFVSGANPATAPPVATTASVNGSYLFTGLAPGSYFIQIPPEMFLSGAPLHQMLSVAGQGSDNGIDDTLDENGDDPVAPATSGVRSTTFTLTPNTEPTGLNSEFGHDAFKDDIDDNNSDLTIDFGFFRPVGVGNLVYLDADGDDGYDAGEGIDGVTVQLYRDTQSPEFDPPLATTTTAGGGFYQFAGLVPGYYVVHLPSVNFASGGMLFDLTPFDGQGADDGTDDDLDENGSDPAMAFAEGVSSLPVALISGTEPTDATSETGAGHANDNAVDGDTDLTVDFAFYSIYPVSFAQWQVQHPLGALGGTTDDPDGDGLNNAMEYGLGLSPSTGVLPWIPFEIELNPGNEQIDAVVHKLTTPRDVTITLQGINDLAQSPGGWFDITTIPPENVGTSQGIKTVAYRHLEQIAAFTGNKGFVRLHIVLDTNHDNTPEAVANTDVWGWSRLSMFPQIATFSNPFSKSAVFTGAITSLTGASIDVAAAVGSDDIAAAMVGTIPWYIEVVSGDNEGHRFEVDELGSNATTILLETGNALNTLTTIPASLAGDRIALRPHWTLAECLPVGKFRASNSSTNADRLMSYTGTAFATTWLFNNGGNPKWVNDATLADRGTRVMDPAEAMLIQPLSPSAPTFVSLGVVRAHKFACPLKQGTRLIAGGYPMDQSATSRNLLYANGLTGATSALRADRVQIWNGDAAPGTMTYDSFYLLKTATLQQWVKVGDSSLGNQNNQPLFKSMHGVYFNSYLGKPDYVAPRPWTP